MIAWDTETHLIKWQNLAPRVVCLSYAEFNGDDIVGGVLGNGDPEFDGALEAIFDGPSTTYNSAFDLAVVAAHRPDLLPKIFDALEAGLVHDVLIRERLLKLATDGSLRFRLMGGPQGKALPMDYGLARLEKFYFGRDRTASKAKIPKHGDDAPHGDDWRLNYDVLDGLPASEYPKEAYDYAYEDAEGTLMLHRAQDGAAVKAGFTPDQVFATEALHVSAAFVLYWHQCRGLKVDLEARDRIYKQLEEDLAPEKMAPLIDAEILRPAIPPKPHGKLHVEGCPKKACDCPPKFTKGKAESVDTKKLKQHIERICANNHLPVKRTPPSSKFPEGSVSADQEVQETLAGLDPLFDLYCERQRVQSLLTRELPKMSAEIVHPNYNPLVSTGRTSCGASDKYPSGNIQNVDVRVRECYEPREGFVYCSSDYGGMELVTLAQTIYDLFGYSTLRNQLNEGVDAHAYLGAQLAFAHHDDFRAACREMEANTTDARYELFAACKQADGELGKFFKTYRTFAKPTGLGYPGGLGPATFCVMAKKQYGIDFSVEEAALMKEVWMETYPEMPHYFKWVTKQVDRSWCRTDAERGYVQRFHYTSPMGMLRRNCSYTETCNGRALQSPGGELAKIGLYMVSRACYDPTQGSILHGRCFPVAFVHDEVLAEIVWDEHTHDVAMEMSRLMVEGGKAVVPDVLLKAEPALMWRWNKAADPVYDENGRLVPWEPKEDK